MNAHSHNGTTQEFALSTDLSGQSAVVLVRGELDDRTGPEVCAAITAAMEQGHKWVILDLSEVTYMGASGLRAVVDCAITLALFGGSLTLRSPSPWVRHILASTGLAGLLPGENDGLPVTPPRSGQIPSAWDDHHRPSDDAAADLGRSA